MCAPSSHLGHHAKFLQQSDELASGSTGQLLCGRATGTEAQSLCAVYIDNILLKVHYAHFI